MTRGDAVAIETRCQHCGAILAIADEHAGKRARCTRCQAEYTVPEATDEAALDAVCHYCGAALPPGHTGEDPFKTCADCQDSILENEEELAAESSGSAWESRAVMLVGVVAVALFAVACLIHALYGKLF